jgi:YD repeat-containing protein
MVNGTGITITQTGNQFTIAHADTSSQATSTNTGATVIQSIGLDAMGHISSISTKTLTTTDIGAVPTSDVVTSPTANKILKLDANSKLPANITGNADGNAATATKLSAAKTITVSGDVDGTVTTDFSTNPSISLALDSIVAAGSNTKVTYDAKGRVTSATRAKPSEVGITTSATASPPSTPVDGDLWFEITG